jgi:hypothetical protein
MNKLMEREGGKPRTVESEVVAMFSRDFSLLFLRIRRK